jgi:hypothetical protein
VLVVVVLLAGRLVVVALLLRALVRPPSTFSVRVRVRVRSNFSIGDKQSRVAAVQSIPGRRVAVASVPGFRVTKWLRRPMLLYGS